MYWTDFDVIVSSTTNLVDDVANENYSKGLTTRVYMPQISTEFAFFGELHQSRARFLRTAREPDPSKSINLPLFAVPLSV